MTGASPGCDLGPPEARERLLRSLGLKITKTRVRMLELLQLHAIREQHVSAEDLHRQLCDSGENFALATVYRVLGQFEALHIVERHQFDSGRSVFELAKGNDHYHLVSVDDGKVLEFSDPVISERLAAIAANQGFSILEQDLTIYVRPAR